jgi:hypothetical protein
MKSWETLAVNKTLATLWNRWNGKVWEFNHLEDGHCVNDDPTSKQPIHDSVWKNGAWSKTFVQLDPGNVVIPFNKDG